MRQVSPTNAEYHFSRNPYARVPPVIFRFPLEAGKVPVRNDARLSKASVPWTFERDELLKVVKTISPPNLKAWLPRKYETLSLKLSWPCGPRVPGFPQVPRKLVELAPKVVINR